MNGVFAEHLQALFFKRFPSQRREYLKLNLKNLRQKKALQLSGLKVEKRMPQALKDPVGERNYFYCSSQRLTAANALRHNVFNKLTPIMLGACQVEDKEFEQIIATSCNEIVAYIEKYVREYKLDYLV
ncbi:hypothetical protein OAO01_00315 [Oligoflexia bacterium]|nr:hypothetical protein [Oligoflexia bacterium]